LRIIAIFFFTRETNTKNVYVGNTSENSFSTTSHLFVAMTTPDIDDVQATGGNTTMLSSSRGVDFYIECAIVVIGIVGAAANALVLYAMIVSKQHTKQLLIYHQNVFDLCSCLLLVLTYTLKLCNIYLSGTLGYWLCMILLSEGLLWCSILGATINLMSVTVERYLKVVRPVWSKRLLRKPVKCEAVAFAWITSIVYNMTLVFSTSAVKDGICYGYVIWKSRLAAIIHGIWNFVSFTVIVLLVFILCYWRILVVIRRQARVMASHSGPGSNAGQSHSNHVQSNVVKTMITVCALYVISCVPQNVYFLITHFNSNFKFFESGYHALVFISFFYICANPFIYAVKFDPVRRVVVGLIPCMKAQQASENVEMAGAGNVARN